MASRPAARSAQLGTLYQRLAPAELAAGIPPSLSMAVGAELYFTDPNDCRRFTDQQLVGACKVLDQHRMVRTFHGPPFTPGFHADARQRQTNCQLQHRALRMAVLLRARKYVVHSPFSTVSVAGENAAALVPAVCEAMEALLEIEREAEIQIVLENLREATPEAFVRVADRIQDPRVGFCLDLAHLNLHRGEPPGVWFRALGSRLTHLHLSDNDGRTDGHVPFGSGTVDLRPLADVLARTGHGPTACLETPIESMITSMAALEKAGIFWGEEGRGL